MNYIISDSDENGIGNVCDSYLIPGDVSGDCKVNVLDMIVVRNNLNTVCGDWEQSFFS